MNGNEIKMVFLKCLGEGTYISGERRKKRKSMETSGLQNSGLLLEKKGLLLNK